MLSSYSPETNYGTAAITAYFSISLDLVVDLFQRNRVEPGLYRAD